MPALNRRTFCGTAAAPFLLRAAPRRPNVIFILTDDQGYGELACHGNPVIRTPHLDKLHEESVRFTNYHSDPLCSPTRSAIMTGRYSARVGVWATVMGRSLLRRDETTMADIFAANGYRTAITGKWHLGDNYPYRPQDRGFGEVLVHGGGGVGQTPDYWGNHYFDDTYFRNGKPEKFKGYCTDVWFDNAIRFIEANRGRPFFLYLPTNAPHAPFLVDPKYGKPYEDAGLSPRLAAFYGMISNIDENVGRLRRKLLELGLAENTLLIFMTDNGTGGGLDPNPNVKFHGFNAGMRAAKASGYEGGHRVPLFLHWPGGGVAGGRDIPQLASHFDLLPTFIDLLGLERGKVAPFDGVSLSPLLRGRGDWPDRTLVVQTQQRDVPQPWTSSAVMTGRWRLVNGKELYDLPADAGQARNLAADHPEVVRELRAAYEQWWEGVSKRFGEDSPIVLGGRQDPSRITCHDWHCASTQEVPWNQDMIRKAPALNGWWPVEFERAGTYEFTLRQQPAEANFPLQARTARLRIGGFDQSKPVPEEATGVAFAVKRDRGRAKLETWFEARDGVTRGAFFIDTRYLGG